MPHLIDAEKKQRLAKLYRQVQRLQDKRTQLEKSLLNYSLMLEGCVYPHWKKCGNGKCKCQRSRKNWHGPYWLLSIQRSGKTQVIYLKKDQVDFFKRGVETAHRYNDVLRQSLAVSKAIDVLFRKIAYYRRAVPFRRGKELTLKYPGRLSDALIQSMMPEQWKFYDKNLNWKPDPNNPNAEITKRILVKQNKIGRGRSPLRPVKKTPKLQPAIS